AVLLGLDPGAPDEPAGPDDQRLVQDDESAEQGQLRPAAAVEAGVEALGVPDDPAVRVAERDGDRVPAAHEDALDERLTAVRVAWHREEATVGSGTGPWPGGRVGAEIAYPAAAAFSRAASIRRSAAAT